jgi:hypothetical protein
MMKCVCIGHISVWIIFTYTIVTRFLARDFTTIRTHVDMINTGIYVDNTNPYSPIDMFIQGSDELKGDTVYGLHLQITFLCSWKTITSGMITIVTDFGHGQTTAITLVPYGYSPITWATTQLVLAPAYSIGLLEDTFVRHMVLTTAFTLSDHIVAPIQPVYNTRVGYIARMHIIPGKHNHLPDLIDIIAIYRPSYTESIMEFLLLWGFVGLYAAFSLMTGVCLLCLLCRVLWNSRPPPSRCHMVYQSDKYNYKNRDFTRIAPD